MDWFGTEGALVATRAIHFAATSIASGALVFRTVVAESVLRPEPATAEAFRMLIRCVAWICLLVATLSGAIWLVLQAASMSGLPPGDTEALSTVLNETQFGQVAEIRLVLAIVLAVLLAYDRVAGADWAASALTLGLTASLAWTGHAGSTLSEAGALHLAADALHLCASAVWIGGLLSLILFFTSLRRTRREDVALHARAATERFSVLGIVSVAALSVTGIVNATMLVGSFRAFAGTDYGQLLMLKLALFAVMLVLAATNRLRLTPRLASSFDDALGGLRRNSAIEFALGLLILTIVALLGMLHPASHLVS
jgi:putative copper resistance protein D